MPARLPLFTTVLARAAGPSAAWAALRPVLSVALAVGAAHALGLPDAWWAAISAFVVMDASPAASLLRGARRIAGTLAGALLGVALGALAGRHGGAFAALLFGASWGGLFLALTRPVGYAWVLGTVTFAMVLCEAWTGPVPLGRFAAERVANVALGTLACLLVEGAWGLLRRWRVAVALPAALPAGGASATGAAGAADAPGGAAGRRAAALHALQGALAVGLLAALLVTQALPLPAQAIVSALAVLIVPLGSAGDAGSRAQARSHVWRRMGHRAAGCGAAAVATWGLQPLLSGHPLACHAALALGVWAGAWLQATQPSWRYAALQFTVAFLMIFVQDHGWTVQPQVAWTRLAGIAAGVGLTCAVMAATGWLARAPRA